MTIAVLVTQRRRSRRAESIITTYRVMFAYFFLPMVVPERKSNRLNLATRPVAALILSCPTTSLRVLIGLAEESSFLLDGAEMVYLPCAYKW